MMMIAGMEGITKPIGQGGQHPSTFGWVTSKDIPLFGRGSTRQIQNFRGNTQLANVVQDCAPANLFSKLHTEPKLFGDHLGIGTHTLRMPASAFVVSTKCLYH
jgi:hypothetical protein